MIYNLLFYFCFKKWQRKSISVNIVGKKCISLIMKRIMDIVENAEKF